MHTRPKIFLGIAFPLIMLLILGTITVAAIRQATVITSAAIDMETGMRGYLLAGKEEFLEPFETGRKEAFELISNLLHNVSDNPSQVERLENATEILRNWQKEVVEPAVALRREFDDGKLMNDVARLIGKAHSKTYFDRFRKQIETFDEVTEGVWLWADGPEAGMSFWSGTSIGSLVPPFDYENWGSRITGDEPNDQGGGERHPGLRAVRKQPDTFGHFIEGLDLFAKSVEIRLANQTRDVVH